MADVQLGGAFAQSPLLTRYPLILQKQVRCLITNHACPEESTLWLKQLGKHMDHNDKSSLDLCSYGCRAAALCEEIHKFLNEESSNSTSYAYTLLEKAEALTAESHSSSIPRPETYETRLLVDHTDLPAPNFRAVFARTFFCSFKLKFLLSVWELLAKIKSLSSNIGTKSLLARIDRVVSQIQTTADELLAATPGIFRSERKDPTKNCVQRYWTDGLRLIWPLRLIAFWPVTRLDQRQSAAKFLRSIRNELGLARATQDSVAGPGRYHPAVGSLAEI